MTTAQNTAPAAAAKPATAPAAGTAAKPAAAAKPKAEPKPARYLPAGKIEMLADKDGKKYGKDNNPKRVNSKSHKVFEVYEDGMTIQALIDAFTKAGYGSPNADLDWNIKHGFMKYVAPATP